MSASPTAYISPLLQLWFWCWIFSTKLVQNQCICFPFTCLIVLSRLKNIFAFSTIPPHRDYIGNRSLSPWNSRTHLSGIINAWLLQIWSYKEPGQQQPWPWPSLPIIYQSENYKGFHARVIITLKVSKFVNDKYGNKIVWCWWSLTEMLLIRRSYNICIRM